VLGDGETIWSDPGTDAVLAFYRSSAEGRIMAMHNLSPTPQDVRVKLDNNKELIDLLSGQTFSARENLLCITLKPYQYLWLI
jgi:hypothetical protein